MNQQLKKNRLTILLIFAMAAVPFGIAGYLAQNPDIVRTGTNKGLLITPPVNLDYAAFSGVDEFSGQNLSELSGHWVLISTVANGSCDKVCDENLDKANRILLMMGKDLVRLRRASLALNGSTQLPANWQDDKRLLKVQLSTSALDNLNKALNDSSAGQLLLMDPLGNVMMRYPAGYDPYHVRDDLIKLLKISQIG